MTNSKPLLTPPPRILQIIKDIKDSYRLWQQINQNLSKTFRSGMGHRIENLFIDILELQFIASYSKTTEKESLLDKTTLKLDLLKFLLQISWENKILSDKKYIPLSKILEIVGKELYGWRKYVRDKNSPIRDRGEI